MLEKSWHGATSLSLLPLSLSQINTQSDFVKDKKLDATINQDLHYTLKHLYIPETCLSVHTNHIFNCVKSFVIE